MTYDPKGWPVPAESEFAELLERFQHDLEQRFPGRGRHLFIHVVLFGAAELFRRLIEEDDLADVLNTAFQGRFLSWRLVCPDNPGR
jgi:hypothetical protein